MKIKMRNKMNQQQLAIIDVEIKRLQDRLIEIKSSSYESHIKDVMENYISGKIDGLKWVKKV